MQRCHSSQSYHQASAPPTANSNGNVTTMTRIIRAPAQSTAAAAKHAKNKKIADNAGAHHAESDTDAADALLMMLLSPTRSTRLRRSSATARSTAPSSSRSSGLDTPSPRTPLSQRRALTLPRVSWLRTRRSTTSTHKSMLRGRNAGYQVEGGSSRIGA